MNRFSYPPNKGQGPGEGEEAMEEIEEIPLTADDLDLALSELDEVERLREQASGESDASEALARKDTELAEMNDRLLRLAAEIENMRRRAEREKQDAGRYAISEFARNLVTVADNFDRALRALPADVTMIEPDMVEGLVTGLRMTEKELLAVFQRFNVNRVFPTPGERFDPNLHQAVAQVPGLGVPAGHVVDVAQPGFTIGDRVLRAAMVTVSLGEGEGSGPAGGAPGSNFDTSA